MYFEKHIKEELMKFKKSFLLVGLIGLSALLITVLAFVWPRWGKKPPAPGEKSKATHTLEQNVLMGMVIKVPGSEPNSYWELKVARFVEQKKIGFMTQFYHVSAQTGQIDWQSRQLQFKKEVKLSSADGKRLVAQELLWDPVHKRVTAEREVKLSAPEFQIFTEKIIANLALEKMTFIGATKLIYQNQ